MDAEQFAKYLNLIDHPAQFELKADEASLFTVYREHLTRFTYQNVDLYRGGEVADLSLGSLGVMGWHVAFIRVAVDNFNI